jgi:hypothetical protein
VRRSGLPDLHAPTATGAARLPRRPGGVNPGACCIRTVGRIRHDDKRPARRGVRHRVARAGGVGRLRRLQLGYHYHITSNWPDNIGPTYYGKLDSYTLASCQTSPY